MEPPEIIKLYINLTFTPYLHFAKTAKFNKQWTYSPKWTPKISQLDLNYTVKSFRVAFMNEIFLQVSIIHAQVLKNGALFGRNEYIETKLFFMQSVVLLMLLILCLVIEGKECDNVFSWAAIIELRCRFGLNEEALKGFTEMQENGVLPDNFMLPNVLKACGALPWLEYGKAVHGYVVKMGFDGCVFVASSLLDMYGKCGVLEDARKVFDGMVERNVIAWNSMTVGYMQNGMNEQAIGVFYDMRVEGVEPTQVSISSFLSASANLAAIDEGKQGHAIAVLGGLELDNILGSSVINFYSKVGLIEDAELVFDRMLEKDVVTWNLIIPSYVQCGLIEKALNTCHLMRLENLRFDCVTPSCILIAAANSSNTKLGKEGHCYCIRNSLQSDVVVASSIVDCMRNVEELIVPNNYLVPQLTRISYYETHYWLLMQMLAIVVRP